MMKMLEKLEENKVSFCYQAQHTTTPFYNLRVNDIHGKEHHINHYSVEEIKAGLKLVRSDIFAPVVKPTGMPMMPMPSPM